MENLPLNKVSNKTFNEDEGLSQRQNKLKFIWLLSSQPTKTFSIDDIVDTIMNSGIMIHEKKFINMMAQNSCRKTGVPFNKKEDEEIFEYKNKYMNNGFDYL